ncbi:phage gp6-like head-tail connector protein [Bacillus paralicheniformis]|nr:MULTISPECIES: head-tail connector protein [Bacillus]MCY8609887.1 head-tail connector protein [Bacillus haynesii]QII49475.1 phage gp6-like head-tail connector protein [Bacillus paralicheniformis]
MAIELEEMKEYLRVDGDEENALISSLIDAAEKYMKNSGAKDTDNELYNLAIKMLVTGWYEDRGSMSDGKNKLAYSLQSIILQLK